MASVTDTVAASAPRHAATAVLDRSCSFRLFLTHRFLTRVCRHLPSSRHAGVLHCFLFSRVSLTGTHRHGGVSFVGRGGALGTSHTAVEVLESAIEAHEHAHALRRAIR